jgi:hypothetical protein
MKLPVKMLVFTSDRTFKVNARDLLKLSQSCLKFPSLCIAPYLEGGEHFS